MKWSSWPPGAPQGGAWKSHGATSAGHRAPCRTGTARTSRAEGSQIVPNTWQPSGDPALLRASCGKRAVERRNQWDKGSLVAGGKQGTGARVSRTGQRTNNERRELWTTAFALPLPCPSAWNLFSKQVLFSLGLPRSELPSCPLRTRCCQSKSFRAEKPNWETKKTYCLTHTFFTSISSFQLCFPFTYSGQSLYYRLSDTTMISHDWLCDKFIPSPVCVWHGDPNPCTLPEHPQSRGAFPDLPCSGMRAPG